MESGGLKLLSSDLSSDVQNLIYFYLWRSNIKDVHKELDIKKIKLMEEVLNKYNSIQNNPFVDGKQFSIEVNNMMYEKRFNLIPELKQVAQFEKISIFYGPPIEFCVWFDNFYEIMEEIVKTQKWIELPYNYDLDIYK